MPNDNVFQLHPTTQGDQAFILCPCTPEGSQFLVVGIVGPHPIITALQCVNCEKEIPVVNGILGECN